GGQTALSEEMSGCLCTTNSVKSFSLERSRMNRGTKLLVDCNYNDALKSLRAEAARNKQDDFCAGAIHDVGLALLCLGRFVEAEEHFRQLMERAPYSVSSHSIGMGLAEWFGGRPADGIATWKSGLKSRYSGYHGLDIPFILYYAAVRERSLFRLADGEALIRQRLKQRHSEYTDTYIAS